MGRIGNNVGQDWRCLRDAIGKERQAIKKAPGRGPFIVCSARLHPLGRQAVS